MTFVKELRDAAMECVDDKMRATVRAAADTIDAARIALAKAPTHENLRALNGAWSSAARILKAVKEPPAPTPPIIDSLSEGAELQRIAA